MQKGSKTGFLKPITQIRNKYETMFEHNQTEKLSHQMEKLSEVLTTLNAAFSKQLKQLAQISSGQSKINLDTAERNYQEQPRFTQMKFHIQDTNMLDPEKRKQNIKTFSADLARRIITKGFCWFQEGKINDQKLRQFFCNNFMANIIRYASTNNLNKEELQFMDLHLKQEVFSFLKKRYPQNQSSEANRKFDSEIAPIDNADSNTNDLVFQSGVKFQYKQNGDYSKQIMQFINYLLNLTRNDQKDAEGNNIGSLSSLFYKDMQQIFQKVQNQQWTINAKNKKFNQSIKLKKLESHETAASQMEEQAKKQKYKKTVKQYTKYLIGQKISNNVSTYSSQAIQEGNLTVTNTGMLRMLTKWCQELEKCFEEATINSREQKFMMADGSERYLRKYQRKLLYLEICEQNKERKKFLEQVMKNIYENQYRMLKEGQVLDAFRGFASEDEGIVGYFATVMKKSYQNYLISYLNKLIHCILSAQKSFLDKTVIPKKQHYKIRVNLISFKIGDLLRCKCSSKETEIIALYSYIKYFCEKKQNKKILELIRVKNRLSEGTKDILINFRYREKLLVQMQLSINQDASHFIKCSDKTNHFIYELERATLGPILELCSTYSVVDPRAQFFMKKFDELNGKNVYRPLNDKDCRHGQDKRLLTSLPIWCDQCHKFTANMNLVTKHYKCLQCNKNRCSSCIIRNGEHQTIKTKSIKLQYDKLRAEDEFFIKKKISVLNLDKKESKENQIYLVYFNFKIMFFEVLSTGSLSYIGQASSKKQFTKFFANKEIMSEINISYNKQDQQQKKIINQINKQIGKIIIKNVKKKYRKYFVFQQAELDDKVLQNQRIETVQQINANTAGLKSIKNLVHAFPNAEVVLIHKNKIDSLDGVKDWKYVKQLNMEGNLLTTVPKEISQLKDLSFFLITNNKFTQFPDSICYCPNLETLNFKENKVTTISKNIGAMKKLKFLRLTKNQINSIPPEIEGLESLEQIDISFNQLESLPDSLRKLKNVKKFLFENNNIANIPNNIFESMVNLTRIDLSGNKNIDNIPLSIEGKSKLNYIDLSINKIQKIPNFIFQLPSINQLIFTENQIAEVSIKSGKNCKLKALYLDRNQLQKIPDEIFQIAGLQVLKISGNPLKSVPVELAKLKNLKKLQIQSLNLKEVPKVIFELKLIQKLSLDDNEIQTIPKQFAIFNDLMKQLYLSKNKFTQIPEQIYKLKRLQNLGFSHNNLTELPERLTQIRSLEKLKVRYRDNVKSIPEKILEMPEICQIHVMKDQLNPGQQALIKSKNKKIKLVYEEPRKWIQ